MSSYPIADFLIQIKNASMARHDSLETPYSKPKMELARVLEKEGYLSRVVLKKEKDKFPKIQAHLRYLNKKPRVTEVVVVSRPGRRVYTESHRIPKVLGGGGVAVISTSSGLMTGEAARKKGIGGELICKIW